MVGLTKMSFEVYDDISYKILSGRVTAIQTKTIEALMGNDGSNNPKLLEQIELTVG